MDLVGVWQEIALQDLALEITVGFVGPMASEYVPSGIPFLRSLNVEPYRINRNELMFVSDAFHKKIKKSSLAPGDVVIVRTGKPGTAAVIPETLPVANCSDLVVVRPGPRLDSRFLAYYINSAAQHHVSAHTVGAVQQHFNVGSAKTLKLMLPSLDEQRAIASILGALDDKIELNRRMNRTLEAMAQAIFRSWFVDFEPVSAKRDGRKPAGMDDATAALFPEHFQDTEMGPVPAGWQTTPIGELVKVVGGSTPRTNEPSFWEAGTIAWATPKDLASLIEPALLKTERRITPLGLSQISSGLLPTGTVLLSSRAPIGYIAIAEVPVAVNQGFISIVCEKELSNHYVVRWLQENMETIVSRANGTTFLEISKANFRPIPAIVPPKAVLDRYSAIADKLHTRLVKNVRQTQQLATLRDTLLPQLLSGKLPVKSAGKLLESAA
jgi:type I restriction enzyme S subunit